MSLSKEEFYSIIEKHLEHPKGVIAIEQDGVKLKKNGAKTNKYNWSKADILREAQSIKDFIGSLRNKGFTNGAFLNFGVLEGSGNRYRHQKQTTLNFSEPQQTTTETPENTTEKMETPPNNNHTPFQLGYSAAQNHSGTVPHVGTSVPIVQVPQHEYVGLKVKEERFLDVEHRYNDAKEEINQYKSELRVEREKLAIAEKKLETIEDRHEFELKKAKEDTKSFLDSESGQTIVGQLGAALPSFFEAMGRLKQPQSAMPIGMGNPNVSLSPKQTQFLEEIKNYPDVVLDILSKTGKAILSIDGFGDELTKTLEQINLNTTDDGKNA